MKLYHGSTLAVKEPRILTILKTSDFGTGFYTTSSLKQAIDWAKAKKRRRKKGMPIVSFFDFNAECAKLDLEIKHFETPDEEWLEFVVANRKAVYAGKKYDLVIDPVADDQTITVIDNYMKGLFSAKVALTELEPQKLTDQYAFLTQKALSYLTYEGVETYEI